MTLLLLIILILYTLWVCAGLVGVFLLWFTYTQKPSPADLFSLTLLSGPLTLVLAVIEWVNRGPDWKPPWKKREKDWDKYVY